MDGMHAYSPLNLLYIGIFPMLGSSMLRSACENMGTYCDVRECYMWDTCRSIASALCKSFAKSTAA